jgi:hypothetical protein
MVQGLTEEQIAYLRILVQSGQDEKAAKTIRAFRAYNENHIERTNTCD